jgi:hypothetical protein
MAPIAAAAWDQIPLADRKEILADFTDCAVEVRSRIEKMTMGQVAPKKILLRQPLTRAFQSIRHPI